MVMDKEELRSALDEGLTQRGIAQQYSCSQTKVRHWLKKHGLLQGRRKEGEPKKCSLCRTMKPLDEFFRREGGRPTSRCKKCLSQSSTIRCQKGKFDLITRKGGQCIRCSYKKCQAALEFHHRDPSQKDIDPSLLKDRRLNAYVLTELEKCDLLCAVCHREVHYEWVMEHRRQRPVITSDQQAESKCCTKCKHNLPKSMFYGFTGSPDGLSWECKPCNYQRKTDHKMKVKQALILSVGKEAKCELCAYNGCMAALDFHHVERDDKEMTLSDIQSLKFTQGQLDEMKKCQVLCVNCHREVHWTLQTELYPVRDSNSRPSA